MVGKRFPNVQAATPTTGQTVVMTDDDYDAILNLTPAGTLAALTITIPSNAKSRIGQVIHISSSQILTSLTISSAGQTLRGAPTTFAAVASAYCSFMKVAANTWVRIA
jgi:hypothetical protein